MDASEVKSIKHKLAEDIEHYFVLGPRGDNSLTITVWGDDEVEPMPKILEVIHFVINTLHLCRLLLICKHHQTLP